MNRLTIRIDLCDEVDFDSSNIEKFLDLVKNDLLNLNVASECIDDISALCETKKRYRF